MHAKAERIAGLFETAGLGPTVRELPDSTPDRGGGSRGDRHDDRPRHQTRVSERRRSRTSAGSAGGPGPAGPAIARRRPG